MLIKITRIIATPEGTCYGEAHIWDIENIRKIDDYYYFDRKGSIYRMTESKKEFRVEINKIYPKGNRSVYCLDDFTIVNEFVENFNKDK